MPYWALRLATLRLLNDNIVGHCVGAGPLDHADSRQFARLACSQLRSLSVRDEFARRALAPCTSKPIEVVPDPAFMLQPAPSGEADALLRSLGLKPGRPIIGVALRRWFHRLGGFVPHRIRSRTGLDRAQGHAEMARMLTQIASALRSLAHRHDAAILLMPTYNVSHEGDAGICRRLRVELRDLTTRLVRIDDPCLYKAVAGHLMLMVSARMHPLILAASMGVPIVGLAYNGKFEALFDALGMPRRLLWLGEFDTGSQVQRLEEMAAAAIGDITDVKRRSQALADTVFRRTAALLTDPGLRADSSLVLRRKLRRVVDAAWQFVPFYGEAWRRAGVDPTTLRLPEDLQRLPIVGKQEFLRFDLDDRIDQRYRSGRLAVESSSGSTGQRFDMYLDAGSLRRRRLRFLRALLSSGYRPGQHLMLISSQPLVAIEQRQSWMQRLGWNYADLSLSEAALLEKYLATRPQVLYGPLSSLLILGQDIAKHRQAIQPPDVLISTGEQLTTTHRRLLLQWFGTEATDFYGMTELGLVAWRRPGDDNYRLADNAFSFEFLPDESGEDLERLIVTDLKSGAMPWIRFDTGDMVRRDPTRPGKPVLEFVGRTVDCLLLPGSRKLSPYRLITALEDIPGIERFEIVQHEDWSVDVYVWSQLIEVAPLLLQVDAAVRDVCESQLAVRSYHRTDTFSASARKLRPVQSFARSPT